MRRALTALLSLVLCMAAHAIESKSASADGVKIHYLEAGKPGNGDTLILLHGYTETSRMWRPWMSEIAGRFHVIAPDLPGIGDSAIPASGIDMETSARRIHALVRSLGIEQAKVVGHDIGLMVAYAYAAQFPAEVSRLALLDAFLPGVAGWEIAYDDPHLWHFRFSGATPEALVHGRERIYFDYFWNGFAADAKHSVPQADRRAYVAAYARDGRMRAGWAYFASWPDTAGQFARLANNRLKMPLLTLGGEKSMGTLLARQGKLVADDVTSVVLPGTGHWVMEERPSETRRALLEFLSSH